MQYDTIEYQPSPSRGVAATPGMLIGARVFQGGMAALMVPQVMAIIHVTFPARSAAR